MDATRTDLDDDDHGESSFRFDGMKRLQNHAEIAQRAYCLWEQAGYPEGRDQEFWLLAEQEMNARITPAGTYSELPPPSSPRHVCGSTNCTHAHAKLFFEHLQAVEPLLQPLRPKRQLRSAERARA